MAANYDYSAIVPKVIAQALAYLRENSITVNFLRRDFDSSAAEKGDTITIPVPKKPAVTDVIAGRQNLNAQDPSNFEYGKVDVTLDYWKQVELELSDKQIGEFMETGASKQLEGAAISLAEYIDAKALEVLALGASGLANEPGTAVPSDPDIGYEANRVLNEVKVLKMDRVGAVRPKAAEGFLKSEKLRDASQSGREDVLRDAVLGRFAGFDWYETNQVYTHTAGTLASTTLTVPAVAKGATSMTLAGTGISGTFLKGDHFRIAGLDQAFVLTADATGITGTTVTVQFAPELPQAFTGGEAVTVVLVDGHRNVAFQRDAAAFVSRPLMAPGGFTGGNIIQTQIDPLSGIALRLELSRINKATQWTLDVLFGVKTLRSEAGVVILDI